MDTMRDTQQAQPLISGGENRPDLPQAAPAADPNQPATVGLQPTTPYAAPYPYPVQQPPATVLPPPLRKTFAPLRIIQLLATLVTFGFQFAYGPIDEVNSTLGWAFWAQCSTIVITTHILFFDYHNNYRTWVQGQFSQTLDWLPYVYDFVYLGSWCALLYYDGRSIRSFIDFIIKYGSSYLIQRYFYFVIVQTVADFIVAVLFLTALLVRMCKRDRALPQTPAPLPMTQAPMYNYMPAPGTIPMPMQYAPQYAPQYQYAPMNPAAAPGSPGAWTPGAQQQQQQYYVPYYPQMQGMSPLQQQGIPPPQQQQPQQQQQQQTGTPAATQATQRALPALPTISPNPNSGSGA
ncbi:hypothetical protein M427DRAFT_58380 [Gonapodya prolifera JEL478]|uniref:Uncharacterized protein n=1 Tax=Gonapodya prolifera (strain JEL478) TaxID=1344416 RepID=A0A139AAM2_GONPJ|nr:hypothetical protein M427DRAFT_58380 [Gonapodya prolifera JEL478]|eukprot:KXS13790.1 hypothetical protein M427DRAFT_58380 [Gonapodya prolifera JEL478]